MTKIDTEKAASSKEPDADHKVSEWRRLRNRMIAGLFVLLPIYITYEIVKWLYLTLQFYAIGPIAGFIRNYTFKDAAIPGHILEGLSVVLALFVVLAILMVAGVFAKTRLMSAAEWMVEKVPGVNLIYRVVSNVFEGISNSQSTKDFKRVVLVEFPHPGMRVPAFVTSECEDEKTGSTILCVYVPTTPLPSSGYMLMVPEEKTTPLNWSLEETLQAIVSGGITVPKTVNWM